MAFVINTPEDVLNLTLRRIGYKHRIGSIWEGSEAAKQALDIYGQTRDDLLRNGDYGFAERNINAVLLKQAPVGGYFPPNLWNGINNPPPPYLFEYQYPQDALKIRSVKPVPLFVMNFDPQPNIFETPNDNYFNPPQKVIVCNVPNAMLVYTAQVTNPQTWEVDFTEELAEALGRRLAPVLANMDAAKMEAAAEGQSKAENDMERG